MININGEQLQKSFLASRCDSVTSMINVRPGITVGLNATKDLIDLDGNDNVDCTD